MKSNAPVRFTTPAKVVAPVAVAADCVKLAALNVLEANTVSADVTVTSLRGFRLPTAPLKRMSPAEVSVRICAPFNVAVATPVPKSISAIVVTRVVVPVRVVFSPKNIEPAVKVPALEFKSMPEALLAVSAPKIVPLATKVMVPVFGSTPLPPMVRLVNPLPPTAVNVPVTVIGAPADVVKRAKLVAAALAEIPLAELVLSITTPSAPVAVSVRVTPPSTTTESLMSKKLCVASALMLVEFPEPFTVKLPVPVITPSILNSPAPLNKKSTVTALLLIHAASTVTAPTLVIVLPRTTESTDG